MSGKACIAWGCYNREDEKRSQGEARSKDVTFHRFPLSKQLHLQKWLDALKRPGLIPSKNHRLCSEHFTPSDYYEKGLRRYLKRGAVPSIFEHPADLQNAALRQYTRSALIKRSPKITIKAERQSPQDSLTEPESSTNNNPSQDDQKNETKAPKKISCIGGVNSVDSQSNNANLKKSLVHNTAPTKSDISYPPRQLRSGKGKTTSERSPDSTEGVKRRKIMSDSSEEEILEASTSFSHSLSELKAASTSKKESPMKTVEAERIGLLSKAEEMLKHAKMMMEEAESVFKRAEMMNQAGTAVNQDDDEVMPLDDVTTEEDVSDSEERSQTENTDVAPVEDILKENKTMLTQAEGRLKDMFEKFTPKSSALESPVNKQVIRRKKKKKKVRRRRYPVMTAEERRKRKSMKQRERRWQRNFDNCPVCGTMVSKMKWRDHVGEHFYFCMEKNKIFTVAANKDVQTVLPPATLDSAIVPLAVNKDVQTFVSSVNLNSDIITVVANKDVKTVPRSATLDSDTITLAANKDVKTVLPSVNLNNDVITLAENKDVKTVVPSVNLNNEVITLAANKDVKNVVPSVNLNNEIITLAANKDVKTVVPSVTLDSGGFSNGILKPICSTNNKVTVDLSSNLDDNNLVCKQEVVINDSETEDRSSNLDDNNLVCKQEVVINDKETEDRYSTLEDNNLSCKQEIVINDKDPNSLSSNIFTLAANKDVKTVIIINYKETENENTVTVEDFDHNNLSCKQKDVINDKETNDLSSNLDDNNLSCKQKDVVVINDKETNDPSPNLDDSNLSCKKKVVINVKDTDDLSTNISKLTANKDVKTVIVIDKKETNNENIVTVEDFVYTCFICKIKYMSFKQLLKHKHSKHRFKAAFGLKKMSIVKYTPPNRFSESYKIKMQERRNKRNQNLTCPDCNQTLSAEKVLQDHFESYPPEKKKCIVCDAEFNRNCALLLHVRTVHAAEQKFPCSICHMNMSNMHSFKKHQRLHKRDEQGDTEPILGKYCVLCEACGRKYGSRMELKFHMLKHDGGSVTCPKCPLTFTSYMNYKTHASEQHRKETSACICDICGAKFHRAQDLKTHHYRAHVHEDLKRRIQRRRRARVGSTISDLDGCYTCDICSQVFTKLSSLGQHRSIHFGNDPSKYTCTFCEKTYTTKTIFTEHYMIHTGMKPQPICKVCNKVFSSYHVLRNHQSVHEDERKYECEVCKARFREKRTLTIHFRTHTGEKRYACRFCDYRAVQGGDRNAHERRHIKQGHVMKSQETTGIGAMTQESATAAVRLISIND